ncbi:hypothetical protein [Fowl aviadenovirus A]|nr:hypothetical protein [Fowl aviadenovirus A]
MCTGSTGRLIPSVSDSANSVRRGNLSLCSVLLSWLICAMCLWNDARESLVNVRIANYVFDFAVLWTLLARVLGPPGRPVLQQHHPVQLPVPTEPSVFVKLCNQRVRL